MEDLHLDSARFIASEVVRKLVHVFEPVDSDGITKLIGGYLNIAWGGGLPIAIYRIGEPDGKISWEALDRCKEKARRLGASFDHETSFESRDPDNGCFGGAINCLVDPRILLSFDGLSEKLDTVVVLMIGYLWGRDPLGRQLHLAEVAGCREEFVKFLAESYGIITTSAV